MHRFFIPPVTGDRIKVTREQAHQMSVVLDLQPGEQVVLLPGDGRELVSEIITIDKKEVSLAVVETRLGTAEPVRQVTLYCAVLKRDNFEWVAQKATECGVTQLVPITTERTVKLGLHEERLQKIMTEAAEQSGRAVVPVLAPVQIFKEALKAAVGQKIFFNTSPKLMVAADVAKAKECAVFIGPEGGWTEAEQVLAEQAGAIVRSLGPRVLRAETAAVVATYNAVMF